MRKRFAMSILSRSHLNIIHACTYITLHVHVRHAGASHNFPGPMPGPLDGRVWEIGDRKYPEKLANSFNRHSSRDPGNSRSDTTAAAFVRPFTVLPRCRMPPHTKRTSVRLLYPRLYRKRTGLHQNQRHHLHRPAVLPGSALLRSQRWLQVKLPSRMLSEAVK